MYVFDATPLIYLAKAERLALLGALEAPRLVPEPVYDEVVVAGLEQGHADARRVERAVDDDVLDVVPVGETDAFERFAGNPNLSEPDAAVLAVADDRDATAVVDEQYGRDVADAAGIRTRGTAYLVVRLLETGAVSADEARSTIDDMVDSGWYCAPDLYAAILRTIDEVS